MVLIAVGLVLGPATGVVHLELAHDVGGLSWPVAWVLAAIPVVSSPTVILPLLRQARLNKESASLRPPTAAC